MTDAALKDWHLEPRSRDRGARVHPGLLMALCALVVAACGMAMLSGALAPSLPSPPPAAPAAPTPTWIEIAKPVPMFRLESRLLAAEPLVYGARRLSTGDARRDVLAFGALAGGGAALRLEIDRGDIRPVTPAPLFAALAREAADAGLSIARSGLPDLMTTRFGRFEIADVTLARTATAGRAEADACSGFRLVLPNPALSILGLACGAPGRPIRRPELACLVDRLDLASAAGDTALIEFFAKTELTRNPICSGMRLGPDEAHAPWLDDKPATPRKTLRRR